VRATDRASRRLLEHVRDRDAHAELVEPLHDALGARATHVAEANEPRFELPRIRQVQSEDVRFDVAFDRAQLNAGNYANADRRTGVGRFGHAVDRIVIGQRDGGETDAPGFLHHVSRRARAVGRRGVNVQVDLGGRVRRGGRRRRHAE
jgi:hypothetical protein